MAWAGGTFTRANGANEWVTDFNNGVGIEPARHDTQDNDLATGINNCLTKDGQNTPNANLPMGGFKHTGVANGSANTDYMAYGQIRNGTPLYMDTTNNRLGINTSTPVGALDIQTLNTGVGANGTTISQFSNNAGELPEVNLRKSRGTTLGTNTIVQNGDYLGAIRFWGANGTGYNQTALITAVVDGTPGATNDMPSRLEFYTTPDGSGSPVERLRIGNGGEIGIGTTQVSTWKVLIKGVDATSANYSFVIQDGAGSPQTLFYVRNDGLFSTGTGAASPYNATTATAANVNVDSAGALRRSTSSAKYKIDITDADHGLQEVLQLRPVTYRGINDGTTVFGGLIAEEVHAIGLKEFIQYAEDGTPDALAYGNMVSLSFKAIQELNAKVEALEARVAELEK
jgi:hypothetical protein